MDRLQRFLDFVIAPPRHLLALWLTCFILAVQPFGKSVPLYAHTIFCLLCVLIVFRKDLVYKSWIWGSFFVFMLLVILTEWHFMDNHKYLMTYWVLACALSVSKKEVDKLLEWHARLLIGFAFMFATVWKLLPGEWLDGSFFYSVFLFKDLFKGIAMLVGGLTEAQLLQNYQMFQTLLLVPGSEYGVHPVGSEALYLFALFSSYWVLFIEGMVAFSFLARSQSFEKGRDYFLLIFLATTYLIAPVERFAITLSVLGFAQCPVQKRNLRICYLLLFVLLPFSGHVGGWLIDLARVLR